MVCPIESEWNSVLLAVSKKDSSTKRFCLDLRGLNKKCKRTQVYIGSVDGNLNKLRRSVCYSALVMSNGFMAIPIAKEDQKYFAFSTSKDGTFAFTRCPFGWVNSPAYYFKIYV